MVIALSHHSRKNAGHDENILRKTRKISSSSLGMLHQVILLNTLCWMRSLLKEPDFEHEQAVILRIRPSPCRFHMRSVSVPVRNRIPKEIVRQSVRRPVAMKWNTLIKTNIEWIQVPFLQNMHHKSWSKISVEDVGPADNSLNPQIVRHMAAAFSRSSCKMVRKPADWGSHQPVEGWNSSLLKEMIASPWWKRRG